MSVTARTGLDDALAAVSVYSIGSTAPYVPCTHVYTDDLRGSLLLLRLALTGHGRASHTRVPDTLSHTELQLPTFDGAGVRYRAAMTVLDSVLPGGVDVVVDAGNIGASAIHYLPVRRGGRFLVALGMGGMGYSFGAGIGVRSAETPPYGGHRRRRRVLHAWHGDSHRAAVPAAGDVRALQQQRPRDVRHPRAAVLRRPLQLQPFRPKPFGRRPGSDVPGSVLGRRRRHRRAARRAARGPGRRRPVGRQHRVLGRRNPAVRTFLDNARLDQHKGDDRPMSLPALEDIAAHRGTTDPIEGVVRIETSPREKATPIIMEMMRSVYPHDEVFGEYCTVNDYVDCPPDELFDYLADTRSLEEWTYSLRGFTPTEEPGLWLAYDRLGSETEIYTRTVANREATHRRLPLRLGPGQAPVDDLPDAGGRRAGGARQARFGGAVDQLPPPVLRPQPVPGDRAAASGRCGSATSGTCSAPATCWS